MHTITQIKQAFFNENFAIIFLDGKFWICIHKNEILKYKLAQKEKISSETKIELEKISENQQQLQQIIKYNKLRPHSKLEVLQYLIHKKKIDHEVAKKLTNQADEKGILNDEEFGKWYANAKLAKGKFGKNRIKMELMQKGLDPNLAVEILNSINADNENFVQDETGEIKRLVAKFNIQIREEDKVKKAQKIIMRMLKRGYDLRKIKEAINDTSP